MSHSFSEKLAAFGTKVSARARRLRWRTVATAAAMVALGVAIVGGIPAAIVCQHYAAEARKFDLSALRQIGDGTRVLDRHGRQVGTVFADGRQPVPLSEVSPLLVSALLATEDARFYEHSGADVRGIARAAWANVMGGGVRQGGSTITQQLARQAFGLRGRTFDRKLRELFLARRIEAACPKDTILECYMNHIYLGAGYHGVEAAARGYFGKPAKALSLEEAALLAGIVKAPVRCSPYRSPEEARRVRNLTLARMEATGAIDSATRARAAAAPVTVLPPRHRHGPSSYLLAAAEREMKATYADCIGMTCRSVRVTADAALQAKVSALLVEHVARVESFTSSTGDLQAAAVVLDNETGEILASVGGRDFRTSPFDRALRGHRPAGTVFLPLTHAAALSRAPDAAREWVLDAPLDNRLVMMGSRRGTLGEWGAETGSNGYEGYMLPAEALLHGKTGAAIRLGFRGGIDDVRQLVQECGFDTPLRPYSSSLLGVTAVRPVEVARAFATLANDGEVPAARPVISGVDTGAGPRSRAAEARSTWVLQPSACRHVRHVMTALLRRPEYLARLAESGLDHAGLAGFGGTAYGWTDAWFAGSDRKVTCVVWMGHDTTRAIGERAWAKDTAFPLWAEIMAAATNGQPAGWPEAAEELVLQRPTRPTQRSAEQAAAASAVVPRGPVVVGEDPYRVVERPDDRLANVR